MLLLVARAAAFSQSDEAGDDGSRDNEAVDEIVVYGQKSLSRLRREMHQASEAFFDVYNALNSDDDFDISCGYETRLGQRRKNHVCKPRFAVKAEARETSSFMMSGGAAQRSTGPGAGFNPGDGYVTPTERRVREKEARMWEEVSELLAEHPEFREALEKLVRARNGYESERIRRQGDRSKDE
jgi:hypothetical protein